MSETKAVTVTEHLPVKIDSYRKQALHDIEHAEFIEQERLAMHLKNVTDSIKGMMKVSHKKQADAAHALHDGFEMAEIAIEQKVEGPKLVTYRLDDNTIVRERPLTAEELRQASARKVKV